MNRIVRRILEMAVAVREFCRAHPSADASFASIIGRLEQLIARLEAVSQEQREGYAIRSSATARRQRLRARLRQELLHHLVIIGEVAAKEKPELVNRFRLPPSNGSNATFLTDARRLLARGLEERELLLKHGLAEPLLDDVAQALDEFAALVVQSADARRQHVSASAELGRLADEVLEVVAVLDGIYRYRFGTEGELAAAWASAKRVAGMPRGPEASPGPVAAGPPAGEGAGGEVQPAA